MIKRMIEQIFQDHAAESLRKTLAEVERAASGKLHNESLADYVTRLASFKYDAEHRMEQLADYAALTDEWHSVSLENGREPDELMGDYMVRIWTALDVAQRFAEDQKALANERLLLVSTLKENHSELLGIIADKATKCGRNEWEQVCGFMDRQFAELKELKQTITENNATIGKLHGTHAEDIARIGTLSVELANETRRLRAYEDDYAQIYALSAAAGMQGNESVGQFLERKLAELSTVTADRDRIRAELAAILAEANKSGRCNGDPVQLIKQGQADLDALRSMEHEYADQDTYIDKLETQIKDARADVIVLTGQRDSADSRVAHLQGEIAEARDQAGAALHECSIWNNAALRAGQTLSKLGKLHDENEAQFIQRMQGAEFDREEQLKTLLAAKSKAESDDKESHRRFMNLIRMADSCGRLHGESVEQFVARQDQRRVSNMEQRDEARSEVARLSALVAELQVELDDAKGKYGGIMAQLGNETPLQLIERMKCLVKDRNRDLEEVDRLRKSLRLEIQDHADARRQLADASKTAFKHGLGNGEVVTDFIERKATELAGALQFGSRMQDMANERGDKLRAALATVESQSIAIAEAHRVTEQYTAAVEALAKLKEWASTIRHKVLVAMVHTKAMAEYDTIMKELDGGKVPQ